MCELTYMCVEAQQNLPFCDNEAAASIYHRKHTAKPCSHPMLFIHHPPTCASLSAAVPAVAAPGRLPPCRRSSSSPSVLLHCANPLSSVPPALQPLTAQSGSTAAEGWAARPSLALLPAPLLLPLLVESSLLLVVSSLLLSLLPLSLLLLLVPLELLLVPEEEEPGGQAATAQQPRPDEVMHAGIKERIKETSPACHITVAVWLRV